ncbi:hypothetical protein Hanom_Chr08g00730591 [Helianthus anomalus]
MLKAVFIGLFSKSILNLEIEVVRSPRMSIHLTTLERTVQGNGWVLSLVCTHVASLITSVGSEFREMMFMGI